MKKTVLAVMVGLLFVASNVYADGDLIVTGKLGVGTDTPGAKLDVVGNMRVSTTERVGASTFSIVQTLDTLLPSNAGLYLVILEPSTGIYAEESAGLTNMFFYKGSVGSNSSSILYAANNVASIGGSGDITVDNLASLSMQNGMHPSFSGTKTLTNGYGLLGRGFLQASGSGTLNVTNYKHIYLKNSAAAADVKLNLTNQTGLWIDKQADATNNYGIVLDGDGAGSDIVFGPNQEARIFSSSGELYTEDDLGNVTQISPHDPETGEWIYYSKNVKTGEVMRVDMERLVRTVEELSGKKFMVKTKEEAK